MKKINKKAKLAIAVTVGVLLVAAAILMNVRS